jgi:NAD+ synthase
MFTRDVLSIDPGTAARQIAGDIRSQVLGTLRRRGIVVGLSGGVDSAVVATLSARAVGSDRVLALLMPEQHSAGDSLLLGQAMVRHLGIRAIVEEVTAILTAAGCYARQAEAIRMVVPGYEDGDPFKVTLPSIVEHDRLNVAHLTVQSRSGQTASVRLTLEAYLQLIAATNFKQRVRKMLEYYHADRLNYAVAGTPNRLEYDQGFFVKQGDGAADVKPIAHLYKTQVYALAGFLGVPEAIRTRPPTTDTFPLAQTQEEFFFSLPYDKMDLCLYARNHGVRAPEVAPVVGLTPEQVERVFRDIEQKRRATRYLHTPPLFAGDIPEVRC